MGLLHWRSWMSSAYIVFYVFLLNKLENFLYFFKCNFKNNKYKQLLSFSSSRDYKPALNLILLWNIYLLKVTNNAVTEEYTQCAGSCLGVH